MSKTQKWIIYELLCFLLVVGTAVIIPRMPLWKYFVLGVGFGLYGIIRSKMEKLL